MANGSRILDLIRNAPVGELDFGVQDFVKWLPKAIASSKVLIALCISGLTPIGFIICFAPWELDPDVFVFQAYIAPEYRGRGAVKEGIRFIEDWADCLGARGVNFETDRPDAWNRLFESEHFGKRIRKEI